MDSRVVTVGGRLFDLDQTCLILFRDLIIPVETPFTPHQLALALGEVMSKQPSASPRGETDVAQ